jgi:hypothetical protein
VGVLAKWLGVTRYRDVSDFFDLWLAKLDDDKAAEVRELVG